MRISDAFPSKYIKASDLQDRNINVVINRVELEEVGDAERKPVLYFQGKAKGLVLNKTNSRAIAAAYGDDTAGWEGRPLILFPAMVDFRGDTVEAIRVRLPKPAAPAADKPLKPAAISARAFDERNPPPIDHIDDEIPF
jgi:hypothetical protein